MEVDDKTDDLQHLLKMMVLDSYFGSPQSIFLGWL